MTEPAYDLVIRGGTVATAPIPSRPTSASPARRSPPSAEACRAGRGRSMPAACWSARRYRQPCPHRAALGRRHVNADTFETPRRRPLGGTTTVIPFAAQHVGMSLTQVVEDYHGLAREGAVIDYAFHMISPTRPGRRWTTDLPPLVGRATARSRCS